MLQHHLSGYFSLPQDDLKDKKVVSQQEMVKCAQEKGFFHCGFCSVKENTNIHEPMRWVDPVVGV